MRFLLLLLLSAQLAFAEDSVKAVHPEDEECEVNFPEIHLNDFKALTQHGFFDSNEEYYFYYEGDSLEDLQAVKNCIDYMSCNKSRESIVIDPKKYRVHIWKSMDRTELQNIFYSCPVAKLNQKLTVRKGGQYGKPVMVDKYDHNNFAESVLKFKASPAIFTEVDAKTAEKTVAKIGELLKQNKTKAAEDLVVSTWGINLRGYSFNYTGDQGGYAVTDHKKRTISYGQKWLSEPCDYIRMLRHELEHVGQMNQSRSCSTHSLQDHKMRERAAHLNDARFIKNVCPNQRGQAIRDFCVERFKTNYTNN